MAPKVGIEVAGANGALVREAALIDTGADESAFPSGFMATFGIEASQCREEEFDTAGGSAKQYRHDEHLNVIILGHHFELPAVFCDVPACVLGRDDFLSKVHFRLDQPNHRFALKLRHEFRRPIRRKP